MSDPLKLLLVAGARPNFMKVAPLIQCVERHNQKGGGARRIACSLVHTGQHYDAKMSTVFFKELGIPAPDVNLEVGSGSHAVQTANVMTRFEPVCERINPDWLVVVGDVNSTMACTLVASKIGIKVAHVEAGLRSFDRTMPEEINRLVTDSIADLLLTPSEDGSDNLRREGVPEERIRLVGNIMIDALVANLDKARSSPILDAHGLRGRDFAYVTLHRPSNVDHRETLQAIMAELEKLAQQICVVFPMHPRTRKMLSDYSINVPASSAFRILDPIGYHDSLCLTENARMILTDSGGLQEESTFFHTPCLTLRPNTERPVTITHGSNRLTSIPVLGREINQVLDAKKRTDKIPAMWDGHTAERIIRELLDTPNR